MAIQGALVVVAVFLFWEVAGNAVANLERQGVASGFGFLREVSGFAVSQSLVFYSEESTYGRVLLVGILNTLLVAGLGIVFASVLGFLIGVARLSSNWLVARLAGAYVEVLRNVPLLLQIFFWYFAVLGSLPPPRESFSAWGGVFLHNRGLDLPSPVFESGVLGAAFFAFLGALGIGFLLRVAARRRQEATGQGFPAGATGVFLCIALPLLTFAFAGWPSVETPALTGFNFEGGVTISREFAALLAALSTYTASFIAEIVRAGILSVHRGQAEAAAALGLKRAQALRLVLIPQALRVIIPPLTSQYLNLAKNSSLAVAIAYPDIVSVFAGTALNQTGQAVEIIVITMGFYLSLSLAIAFLMNRYNARIARTKRVEA